jgi:hypothetical protein
MPTKVDGRHAVFGPTAWDQTSFQQTQHRRRFFLLGQTLEGMQVWHTRRAVQTLRTIDRVREAPLWLQAKREMSGVALYAALFENAAPNPQPPTPRRFPASTCTTSPPLTAMARIS